MAVNTIAELQNAVAVAKNHLSSTQEWLAENKAMNSAEKQKKLAEVGKLLNSVTLVTPTHDIANEQNHKAIQALESMAHSAGVYAASTPTLVQVGYDRSEVRRMRNDPADV